MVIYIPLKRGGLRLVPPLTPLVLLHTFTQNTMFTTEFDIQFVHLMYWLNNNNTHTKSVILLNSIKHAFILSFDDFQFSILTVHISVLRENDILNSIYLSISRALISSFLSLPLTRICRHAQICWQVWSYLRSNLQAKLKLNKL